LCSICEATTSGPSTEGANAVNNVGVAAHIAGARPGSKRFNQAMAPAERSSIDNGIWLCQNCAKAIDGDECSWTVMALVRAKVEAEHKAQKRLGRRTRQPTNLIVEASTCHYIKQFSAAYVPVHIVNEGRRAVTVSAVTLRLGTSFHAPALPIENLILGNLAWLEPPPLRLEADDAKTGAWFFGCSFRSNSPPVEAFSGLPASLEVCAVGRAPLLLPLTFLHPDDKSIPPEDPRNAYVSDDGSVR